MDTCDKMLDALRACRSSEAAVKAAQTGTPPSAAGGALLLGSAGALASLYPELAGRRRFDRRSAMRALLGLTAGAAIGVPVGASALEKWNKRYGAVTPGVTNA